MTTRMLLVFAMMAAMLAPGATAGAQQKHRPWATVNVCDPGDRPGAVGVRVSMPNRRDAAQWMRVRIQYFDASDRAWRVVRSGGDGGFRKMSAGGGRVSGGRTFVFVAPEVGGRLTLRGLVTLQWRRGGRVLHEVQVRTTAGLADPHDPHLQASRATCEIAR